MLALRLSAVGNLQLLVEGHENVFGQDFILNCYPAGDVKYNALKAYVRALVYLSETNIRLAFLDEYVNHEENEMQKNLEKSEEKKELKRLEEKKNVFPGRHLSDLATRLTRIFELFEVADVEEL